MILDVGCGYLPSHTKKGHIGIDLVKGSCDVQASAYHLPFRSDSFEKVVMSHVLEHFINPGLVLNEVKRLLFLRGLLEIEVPNPSSFWIFKSYVFSRKANLGNPNVVQDHVCTFGESELQNLLREIGFAVTKIEYVTPTRHKRRMEPYGLTKKNFYKILFRLFPAFQTELKITAKKT